MERMGGGSVAAYPGRATHAAEWDHGWKPGERWACDDGVTVSPQYPTGPAIRPCSHQIARVSSASRP